MSDEGKFIIFCIGNYKVHKSLSGKEVTELFEKYNVFEYIGEFYDILKTVGYQYINNDIDALAKALK